ncbi:MAG: hypothetical protein IJB10_03430 [Clostridia bacterium]|nr:hypothetical protein [Clostridia bacterium]
MELTQRQIWKTLRSLVTENNNEIKRVYSSAVAARFYARNSRCATYEINTQAIKQKQIGEGLKIIYQKMGDKLIGDDFESKDYYHQLLNEGKNWYDKLSSADLFQLYILQNKVLTGVSTLREVTTSSVSQVIATTRMGKYFTSGIDFSGKPAKVTADQEDFDITDPENIEQVLITATQNAYNRYLRKRGEEPELISPEDVSRTNFGRFSGRVAQTYFKSYQAEIDRMHEEAVLNRPDKMVGVDKDMFPVFERVDAQGNVSYYTYVNDNFSGQVFGEDEQGREIFIGEFGVEENIPTDETEDEDFVFVNPQMPFKKPDVAVKPVTEGTDFTQLNILVK